MAVASRRRRGRRTAGASSQRPCSGPPRRAAKQAPESKRGKAAPVDRALAADERRRLQVADQRVVLDPRHSPRLLETGRGRARSRPQGVEGASQAGFRSPEVRRLCKPLCKRTPRDVTARDITRITADRFGCGSGRTQRHQTAQSDPDQKPLDPKVEGSSPSRPIPESRLPERVVGRWPGVATGPRVDQRDRVDDRMRAAHRPQREALAIRARWAALDGRRDGGRGQFRRIIGYQQLAKLSLAIERDLASSVTTDRWRRSSLPDRRRSSTKSGTSSGPALVSPGRLRTRACPSLCPLRGASWRS